MRQNGSTISGAQPFSQDIIDSLIQEEILNQCSPFPLQMGDENLSQDLSKFNGFIEKSANSSISLPFEN